MKKVAEYTIHTGMGKSQDWGKLGLSQEQIDTLNDIGYGTNKEYGRGGTGFENYLNSFNPNVQYYVKQTKADNGDFSESFLIIKMEASKEEATEGIQVLEGDISSVTTALSLLSARRIRVSIEILEEDPKEQERQRILSEKKRLLSQLDNLDQQLYKLL